MALDRGAGAAQRQGTSDGWRRSGRVDLLLNRALPSHVRITATVRWPLSLVPFLLLLQLTSPSAVWVTVITALLAAYALAYSWVRLQAEGIYLTRQRQGVMVVAGDSLVEEFLLQNESALPLLWAEFRDESTLPGYRPSRIVTTAAHSHYRWRAQAECQHRGVYRLGPHRLHLGDPLGLFGLEIWETRSELVLVYPRVVHLPRLALPRGSAAGRDRRRSLAGSLRSASVRDYIPGDSLRRVHWPTSARRGQLTVTEEELEPSGDLWIVLDLERALHRGSGEFGTLEYSIILAASLAADLLSGGERRSVGLLAVSGQAVTLPLGASASAAEQGAARLPADGLQPRGADTDLPRDGALLLPPQPGRAQMWQILAALAPVEPGDLPLATLLSNARKALGRGRTVVVITPDLDGGERGSTPSWVTALADLQAAGLSSSVLLVAPAAAPQAQVDEAAPVQKLLAQLDVPSQRLQAGVALQPALTFRRTRTVVRTTPSGGVVTYEVEEEVG